MKPKYELGSLFFAASSTALIARCIRCVRLISINKCEYLIDSSTYTENEIDNLLSNQTWFLSVDEAFKKFKKELEK